MGLLRDVWRTITGLVNFITPCTNFIWNAVHFYRVYSNTFNEYGLTLNDMRLDRLRPDPWTSANDAAVVDSEGLQNGDWMRMTMKETYWISVSKEYLFLLLCHRHYICLQIIINIYHWRSIRKIFSKCFCSQPMMLYCATSFLSLLNRHNNRQTGLLTYTCTLNM